LHQLLFIMKYSSAAISAAVIPAAVMACPGSASSIHAKCEMKVTFSDSCNDVVSEMTARVNSGWVDPHNAGTYSISNSTDTFIAGQRVTGDQKYTDLFDFSFTASGDGCVVEACSESQVMSIKDFSTNYCNLHDLYCNSADGCPTAGKDLSYSESFSSCSEHDSSVCVASTFSATKEVTARDEEYAGPWRTSLDGEGSCWTEGPSCSRVLTTVHGGDWSATIPYDSMPAFERAWEKGADSVKGDFRVTKDNIGMVMHSSPVEIYESFNCWRKKVEEMTAEEAMQCQMINPQYNFISVPDMLAWADGKVNVMFCVKESTDLPRAISTLVELDATHRAFLEVHVSEFLQAATDNYPGWDQVYYVIEVGSTADIDNMLAVSDEVLRRAFLFEFKDYKEWPEVEKDMDRVKARGVRTMTMSNQNPITATVQNHVDLFHAGFDVAYTYNTDNAMDARYQVNTEREISPA
jgi:glycerophosphoryl diester phosphodiesterase